MRLMAPTARLHQEALQFRLILAATYPFFLAAAALGRIAPHREPGRAGIPAPHRSVFGEARAMAIQAIPFAFMG